MTKYKALFKVGQRVNYKDEELGKILSCTVTQVESDHIIIVDDVFNMNLWIEEGFNLGNVYPVYGF